MLFNLREQAMGNLGGSVDIFLCYMMPFLM